MSVQQIVLGIVFCVLALLILGILVVVAGAIITIVRKLYERFYVYWYVPAEFKDWDIVILSIAVAIVFGLIAWGGTACMRDLWNRLA